MSRKAMLEDVWGVREDTDTRAIDNFIVRLRRYIEDDPASPKHLQTVRGVGYRFVADPARSRPDPDYRPRAFTAESPRTQRGQGRNQKEKRSIAWFRHDLVSTPHQPEQHDGAFCDTARGPHRGDSIRI